MLVLVIAVAIGVLAAMGLVKPLAAPAGHLSTDLVTIAHRLAAPLVSQTPHSVGGEALVAVFEAVLPALVAAALLVGARTIRFLRYVIALIAVVLGVAGLGILAGGQAALLAGFCVLVVAAALIAGVVLEATLGGLGAYLATATVRELWTSKGAVLHATALHLSRLGHLPAIPVEISLSLLICFICSVGLATALRTAR